MSRPTSCHHCPMERVFTEKFKAVELRFNERDTAQVLRDRIVDDRIRGTNELRREVTEDRELLVRKEHYEVKHSELERWIKSVDTAVNRITAGDGPVSVLSSRITVIETRLYTVAAIIVFAMTLVQVVLHFWDRVPK